MGYGVSGNVESFNSGTDQVTIQLIELDASEAAYKVQVSGGTQSGNKYTASYSFSDVPSGTYTMKVMKQNHVTREYTITVGAEAVVKDVTIWLYGDVTGDGAVNAIDAMQINRKYTGKTSVFGSADAETEAYRLLVADVNAADGMINATDSAQVKRFYTGKPSVIDTLP